MTEYEYQVAKREAKERVLKWKVEWAAFILTLFSMLATYIYIFHTEPDLVVEFANLFETFIFYLSFIIVSYMTYNFIWQIVFFIIFNIRDRLRDDKYEI